MSRAHPLGEKPKGHGGRLFAVYELPGYRRQTSGGRFLFTERIPEKWNPVFGQEHAKKRQTGSTLCRTIKSSMNWRTPI